MAEGLARSIAASMKFAIEFSSAGVMTRDGLPASEHGVAELRDRGVDISAHRSRTLRSRILEQADLVVAMEEEHRLAIREFPAAAMRPVLLLSEWAGDDAPGAGVEDPIGGSRQAYHVSAEIIESYIKRALEAL